jgi:hypothetical protein
MRFARNTTIASSSCNKRQVSLHLCSSTARSDDGILQQLAAAETTLLAATTELFQVHGEDGVKLYRRKRLSFYGGGNFGGTPHSSVCSDLESRGGVESSIDVRKAD